MKKALLAVAFLLSTLIGYSQCTPTGLSSPGVSPDPDNITCIQRGVLYEQILQTQNFDSLVVNVPFLGPQIVNILFTRIDSLTNFPCGIQWETDRVGNTYGPGESGCIRVFGTSTDLVGQYPLEIHMTMSVAIPALSFADTLSGEIGDLYDQLNDFVDQIGASLPFTLPDLAYYSRVIQPGNTCPDRDTTSSAVNLISSGASCPPVLVAISGNPNLCEGTILTADTFGAVAPVTYLWSPNGETTQSITAGTAGTYSVTVTASNGTAANSATVGAAPTAGFTVDTIGATAVVTDTSSGGSATYDYGDGGGSTSSTSYTYASGGTYTITQTVTNSCGTVTATQTIVVGNPACNANPVTGNPGVTPDPDNIGCITRGVFYEQIIQTENFDVISAGGIGIDIVFTRIDSLTNFPCGIEWETDRPDNQYGPGEAGCIRIYGTSRDLPGQYPLNIYITMQLDIPVLGTQTFSGEYRDLINQLTDFLDQIGQSLPFTLPDLAYYSRVIEPNQTCPDRDTTAGAVNLVSSGAVCPPFFVTINGNPDLCAGTTLTADTLEATPPVTFSWSPGGETTQSITAATGGTYSVTVTAANGTVTRSETVQAPPTAGFTPNVNGTNVIVVNGSTGGTSITYNYGDGTATTNATSHNYATDGNYTITQTVTNACGTDTATEPIVIVGIFSHRPDNISLDIIPNPNYGSFAINIKTNEVSNNYSINLLDLQGRKVFSEIVSNQTGNFIKQINVEHLDKGIYFIQIDSESLSYIDRVIIH